MKLTVKQKQEAQDSVVAQDGNGPVVIVWCILTLNKESGMRLRVSILALLLALASGAAVHSQAKAILTVVASEGPAQVFLSGKPVGTANPQLVVSVAPGRYEISVRKAGLPEFKDMIVVGATGLTVRADLGSGPGIRSLPSAPSAGSGPVQANPGVGKGTIKTAPAPAPMTPQPIQPVKPVQPVQPVQPVKVLFSLTVSANAPGAQVSINGTAIGQVPAQAMLEGGDYEISVTAPGYEPYSRSVQVRGNTSHEAVLRQILNRLSVAANIPGAEVYLNNAKAGNAPFLADLLPGTYNLRVSAPGYQDYNTVIVMNGPQTINAALAPLFATVSVSLPSQYLNRDQGAPRPALELFIDGARQSGLQAQASPGQRTIRVTAGFLSFESIVVLEAGRSYTIEPALSLNVK